VSADRRAPAPARKPIFNKAQELEMAERHREIAASDAAEAGNTPA
jgi:hypothetical protein